MLSLNGVRAIANVRSCSHNQYHRSRSPLTAATLGYTQTINIVDGNVVMMKSVAF
ncbi:MAG: hypothetical protein AAFW75_01045 [Cyanobacteria bacterium J06636_16]